MLRRFIKPRCLKTTFLAMDLAFKSATAYFLYRIYTTLTRALPIAIPNNPPNLDDLNNSTVLEDSHVSVGSTDLDPTQEDSPPDNNISDTQIDNNTGIHKKSFWSLGRYLNNTDNNQDNAVASSPPPPEPLVASSEPLSVTPPPPAATPVDTSTPASSIYMGSVQIN